MGIFTLLAVVVALPAFGADTVLLKAAQSEQSAVVATLEKLVNVESGTGDKVGIAEMGQLLEKELKALGFAVTRHKGTGKSVGDNLVGRLSGTGGKNLLLMAHMDTVYARGALAKAPFRIDGNLVYGPGIADDKGGIAVILHGMKLLKARSFQSFGAITVLFNVDEEGGSAGSRALIRQLAGQNDAVLSFEPSTGTPELIPEATSGIGAAFVDIKGKASHAGMAPELGVNALVEAADFILRTVRLDEGPGRTRFNWTVAEAGNRSNVIPDHALIRADVRYSDTVALEKIQGELNKLAASPHIKGSEIEVDVSEGRPAFNANEGGKALIRQAVAIYSELGQPLEVIPRIGGGTDAAFAAQANVPVVEGLGLPGFGFHTSFAEYVYLDAIPRRLYLAVKMIEHAAARRR